MEEDFYNYLRDSNNIGEFHYGDKSKIMIHKIQYNSKIDILYCLDSYKGEFFDLSSPFKYAGIYDKENDKVYDLEYSIRWHILNWDYQNDKFIDASDLYNTISKEINSRIQELISDGKNDMFDISNFEIEELEDRDVIHEFMEGLTSFTLEDEVKKYNTSQPKNLLAYLTEKEEFIEETSREFIIDNMEDILKDLVKSEGKRRVLKTIEDNKNHPYFKIRDITNAIKNTNCKTVNITINKDNIEQTFIYDANSLKYYNDSYLSIYNIVKLADREKFEENFGRYADFHFPDIIKMTYGKKTIYEDDKSKTKEEELCLS